MDLDLDTFLVALYTIVDDLYREHFAPHRPRRRGAKPQLSDSEVLTLLLCAQLTGWPERRMVAYAHKHWRSFFPRLISQGATNRRGHDLAGVLMALVPLLAQELGCEAAPYQAFDTMAVPLLRRCRGERHRLYADEAGIGRGGSDRDWYYGCRLLVAVTPQGVITGFVVGSASTQERWLAEAFLCWRHDPQAQPLTPADLPPPHPRKGDPKAYVGPTGPIWPRGGVGVPSQQPYVADAGFAGRVWVAHWAHDYAARVLTPGAYEGEQAKALKHQHACWRHIVETVNECLGHRLRLFFPGARSAWGLLTRMGAKLAAFNLSIWLNRRFGQPDLALATIFNC
jgi:hypothetical protein